MTPDPVGGGGKHSQESWTGEGPPPAEGWGARQQQNPKDPAEEAWGKGHEKQGWAGGEPSVAVAMAPSRD